MTTGVGRISPFALALTISLALTAQARAGLIAGPHRLQTLDARGGELDSTVTQHSSLAVGIQDDRGPQVVPLSGFLTNVMGGHGMRGINTELPTSLTSGFLERRIELPPMQSDNGRFDVEPQLHACWIPFQLFTPPRSAVT